MASIHQKHVAEYHAAITQGHHAHGGHDMFLVHRQWHVDHPDPQVPMGKNSNWGANLAFGMHFLQMHHEMVSAKATEPKQYMQHDSIVAWYQANKLALPAPWQAGTVIPTELGYEPDLAAFPPEIQKVIEARAKSAGKTPVEWLTRKTDHPKLQLPNYFTVAGIGPGEPPEPVTGARKLADFKNVNQLGCCIVWPHNAWHMQIVGAMGSPASAIADPIFYFGVHWHIDRVYQEYLQVKAAAPHPLAAGPHAAEGHAFSGVASVALQVRPFSASDAALLEQWRRDSAALQSAL